MSPNKVGLLFCQRELWVLVGWVNLFPKHAFDGRLELDVLGGVDERVDATVSEYQEDSEIVEPSREVRLSLHGINKVGDRVGCPAYDESTADHQ